MQHRNRVCFPSMSFLSWYKDNGGIKRLGQGYKPRPK